MDSLREFRRWCQVKLLGIRKDVRQVFTKENQQSDGPYLTPETVPTFVIPDLVSLSQHSEERHLCVEEELVLNSGLAFHSHETKKTKAVAGISKLELLKQNQFKACMTSWKTRECNQSSTHEDFDGNDTDLENFPLNINPQSPSFPSIEDIPSVYFGQLDQEQVGSFYRKKINRKPPMSPPRQDIIHHRMVSFEFMEEDPLPRRDCSIRSPNQYRRRSSLPSIESMTHLHTEESDKSDISKKSHAISSSDGKSIAKQSVKSKVHRKNNSVQDTRDVWTHLDTSRKTRSLNRGSSSNPSRVPSGSSTPISTSSIGPKLRAELGELKFDFTYLRDKKQLKVVLLRGVNIGGYKTSDYNMNVYVQLCLVPCTLQTEFSTEQKHTKDPYYNEEFFFSNIKLRDVQAMTLQMKIYNNIPYKPKEIIGEISVALCKYDILAETRVWRNIETKTNRKEDLGHICLSLNINTRHKELLVNIGRVTGLSSTGKSCDTYVTVDVSQQSGDVIQKRTRDQNNWSNPVFNELLTFDLPSVDLDDLTTTCVTVSVFKVKLLFHDKMLGQVRLGYDSTEDSERLHWQEALLSQGRSVGKWHYLMESGDVFI